MSTKKSLTRSNAFVLNLLKSFFRHSHRPYLLALTQPSLRHMPLSIKCKSHPLNRLLTQCMLQDLEWVLNNSPPLYTRQTSIPVLAYPHSTNPTSINSSLPISLSRPEFPSKEHPPPLWLVLTPTWVILLSLSTILSWCQPTRLVGSPDNLVLLYLFQHFLLLFGFCEGVNQQSC